MDPPNGSNHSSVSVEQWTICDERFPRAQIVYFAQLLVCLILIISSIVMLALHDPNKEYWMVCLSFTLGYIMPNPTLHKNVERK